MPPRNDLLTRDLIHKVQVHLTDDLRRPPYKGSRKKMAGHCYVASEVIYHILGGRNWKPCFIKHEGHPHWFLQNRKTGEIIDATRSQFKTKVPYELGKGKGFLTKLPSARAQTILGPLRLDLELDPWHT